MIEILVLEPPFVPSLALKMKVDPAALREQNFIKAEQFPYKSASGWEHDSGN